MTSGNPDSSDLGDFYAFRDIVARLRGPGGCPWDREQTHASLKTYLIEEAYEVVQALDEADHRKLCEELGDLLLQIALHAQIGSEAGEFDIADVIRGISTKLVRRHPHVFGGSDAGSAREVAQEWEKLKLEEREAGASLLSNVPVGMPALSRSHSIQRRAAGVGFDWEEREDVLEKLAEEVRELQGARSREELVHEFGDLLFALVNVARWQEINLEEALRLANERFCRRFGYMEQACREKGIRLGSLPLEEQDALWDEAKSALKDRGGPDVDIT